MSKKIIDEMIAELLQEVSVTNANEIRFQVYDDAGNLKDTDSIDVQGDQSKSAIFNTLKILGDPATTLDDTDFEYLQDNPKYISPAIEKKLIALKKGLQHNKNDASKQLVAQATRTLNAKHAAIKATAEKDHTITAPRLGKPQAATRGVYSTSQEAILKKVMKNVPMNIKARVKKISEISQKYFNAASKGSKIHGNTGTSKVLSEIMLLDMLTFIVKDIDAGSGGYLFEYFLAYLAGGKVKGKDPSTKKGKMGATDFTDSRGKLGSSKYYAKGQKITQAASGFGTDTTTTYIVAVKKQDAEQFGFKSLGTSTPDRIIGMDLYMFDVVVDRDRSFTANGQGITPTDGTLNFTSILSSVTPVELHLAEVYTQTFKEMMGKAISKTKGETQKAFAAMQNFYESMLATEETSRVYIAEGDPTLGIEVLKKLDDSEAHFAVLQGQLTPKEEEPVTESKLQTLDQLIAETIRDIRKK